MNAEDTKKNSRGEEVCLRCNDLEWGLKGVRERLKNVYEDLHYLEGLIGEHRAKVHPEAVE